MKSISKEFGDCEGETVRCITATVKYIELKESQLIGYQAINTAIKKSIRYIFFIGVVLLMMNNRFDNIKVARQIYYNIF